MQFRALGVNRSRADRPVRVGGAVAVRYDCNDLAMIKNGSNLSNAIVVS